MNSIQVQSPVCYNSLFKKINDKNEAHEKLLRLIADFKTRGFTYKRVLYNNELKAARDIVAEKFDETESYPYYNKIVQFIYTRDKVCNPFGRWVKYDFFEPLACFEYARNLVEKKTYRNIKIKKLAGLIFSLLCLEPSMDENDGKHILRKPNRLYQIAGITQESFSVYANLLECDYHFPVNILEGEYKTSIVFTGLFELRKKIIFHLYPIQEKYYQSCKNLDLTSGINFRDNDFEEICINYETKYLKDRYGRFHFRGMNGNPFCRIHRTSAGYSLSTQLYILRYDIILKVLYTKKLRYLTDSFNKSERESILNIRPKRIMSLKEYLIRNGINATVRPISSPNNPTSSGEHFQQIKDSIKVVNDISKNGIYVPDEKIRVLLSIYNDKEAEIFRDPINNSFLHNFEDYNEEKPNHDEKQDEKKNKRNKYSTLIAVKTIINELRNIHHTMYEQGYGDNRLRGLFIPHGANTHRMSCRKYNLQAISRELRKKIFTATPGWKLLSADVSGQDIAIGANLAGKIFIGNPETQDESRNINETLSKLSMAYSPDNRHKPIDYLTNLIIREKNLSKLWDKKLIREAVKKIIYTTSYGGGINTIIKNQKKKFVAHINNSIELLKLPDKLKPRMPNKVDDFKRIKKYLEELQKLNINIIQKISYSQHLNDIDRLANKLVNEDIDIELWLKEIRSIYDFIIEKIKINYPGIIEAFDYYNKYTEDNKLTYPSLLGWQTPTEILNAKFKKVNITRSKSYPIQSSGAEFIRQWIIELSHEEGYNKDFRIINAIHDQLIVEAKDSVADHVSIAMLETAKSAARKVNLIPETIKIPEIEVS